MAEIHTTPCTTAKTYTVPQAHGVLVVHKPKGPTSTQCIRAIKRLGQKKIGHGGTLDPMAEGVLLVLLGQGTKISGHLMNDGAKIYKGTLRLGQQTDTWDAEGKILAEAPWQHIDTLAVQKAMQEWLGQSEQPVPPYSAAKHQGQPLYKLARSGKAVPEKIKIINISRVEVLTVNLPYASFRVECSSGTYIRSLAHSLGTRLGCGAILTELIREYSHPFGLEDAHTPEALCAHPECLQDCVMPITRALPHWPLLTLNATEELHLRNGMPILYRPALAQNMHTASSLTNSVTSEVPTSDTALPQEKALLLSLQGDVLALAQRAEVHGKDVWTIIRGLWT